MPTIKAVLIAPIREAIYNRLSDAADTLAVALSCAEREQSLRARQAFVRLLAVAELLHRIGPTEQESTGALALATIGEATLIVGALHEQPLH